MSSRKRTIKAYTALRRTREGGPWYMSPLLHPDAEQFREVNRITAARCRKEGDRAGEALWSDDANMRIIPVEVEIPEGVELVELTASADSRTPNKEK